MAEVCHNRIQSLFGQIDSENIKSIINKNSFIYLSNIFFKIRNSKKNTEKIVNTST